MKRIRRQTYIFKPFNGYRLRLLPYFTDNSIVNTAVRSADVNMHANTDPIHYHKFLEVEKALSPEIYKTVNKNF